jgi:hypothetical protein
MVLGVFGSEPRMEPASPAVDVKTLHVAAPSCTPKPRDERIGLRFRGHPQNGVDLAGCARLANGHAATPPTSK